MQLACNPQIDQMLPPGHDVVWIVEFEQEPRGVCMTCECRKDGSEIDIPQPGRPVRIEAAIVVLEMHVCQQITILTNPLGDTRPTAPVRDAHGPHIDAVPYAW